MSWIVRVLGSSEVIKRYMKEQFFKFKVSFGFTRFALHTHKRINFLLINA